MVRDDSHEKSQWTNNLVIRGLPKSERQKTQVLPTFKVYEQLYWLIWNNMDYKHRIYTYKSWQTIISEQDRSKLLMTPCLITNKTCVPQDTLVQLRWCEHTSVSQINVIWNLTDSTLLSPQGHNLGHPYEAVHQACYCQSAKLGSAPWGHPQCASISQSLSDSVGARQGLMQDKIIASHICFGGHMDVNC